MKDVDIMRNVSHCIKHECTQCDYLKSEGGHCNIKMMQDANCIMKMQHDALKGFAEELAKKDAEIERYKPMARYNFDEDTLVKAVNDIIYACLDDFDNYDDGGNAYRRMLEVILEFGQMLPGNYKVEIIGMECPPKLVKQ